MDKQGVQEFVEGYVAWTVCIRDQGAQAGTNETNRIKRRGAS